MQFFSKNLFTSFKDFQKNDKKKKEKLKKINYGRSFKRSCSSCDRKGDWEAHLLAIQHFTNIQRI